MHLDASPPFHARRDELVQFSARNQIPLTDTPGGKLPALDWVGVRLALWGRLDSLGSPHDRSGSQSNLFEPHTGQRIAATSAFRCSRRSICRQCVTALMNLHSHSRHISRRRMWAPACGVRIRRRPPLGYPASPSPFIAYLCSRHKHGGRARLLGLQAAVFIPSGCKAKGLACSLRPSQC